MKSIRSIVGSRDTVSVHPLISVFDAARLMTERQIGAVAVVDGERLTGIFTERDVMVRIVAGGREPRATPVADVMSTELVIADIGETCDACLAKMQQARVRHLIVLDGGRLAGIVSLRDLMAADLDDKDEALTLLNAYVHYIPADLTKVKT
jgi:CBS domain-containing protein